MLAGLVWSGVELTVTAARRAKCQVEHFFIVESLCAAAIILAYLSLTGQAVPSTGLG